MAKDKVVAEEPVEVESVPEGAVLLYSTGDTRVYQVGNATGDGREGRATRRIVVKVTETEEVQG